MKDEPKQLYPPVKPDEPKKPAPAAKTAGLAEEFWALLAGLKEQGHVPSIIHLVDGDRELHVGLHR